MGDKESGKTILLDKLLIEFTDKIHLYNKVPVYIDLLKNVNRFETEISKFLNIKILNVEELLHTQSIVLLIDNISTSSKSVKNLKNLEVFLQKYEKVTVVATTTTLISSSIPFELKDYPTLSKFTPVNINSFKSKEIRELAENWFSTNPNYNNNNSYEEIITVFNKLDISRTPLAVSMLLCIIELQPNNKPVNNSSLLENFIEILFQKHDPQEIYSEKFDYKNKIRLASEIAYKMYEVNDYNYRINRIDLIKFIEQYLISRRFDFKADDIFFDLEEAGIFSEESDNGIHYVQFRFNCFFRYFLMKNMEFNPQFKKYVLSEERYLYFIDEIDYYTGSKRDEEEILQLVANRMEQTFDALIKEFVGLEDIDMVFRLQNELTINLREVFLNVETIPEASKESIDQLHDAQLEASPSTQIGVIKDSGELSYFRKLEGCWVIVAKVLKNTEETSNGEMKLNVYQNLLKCAALQISLARLILEKERIEKQDYDNSNPFYFILDFLPLGLQMVLRNLVSSSKLIMVMEDDVREKIDNFSDFSEFEIFLSIMNFADSKSSGTKYIKDFIKNSKNNYIHDNLLAKLAFTYRLKPTNSSQETEYLNLIGDLKTKNYSPVQRSILKSRIIEQYKDDKAKKIRNGEL